MYVAIDITIYDITHFCSWQMVVSIGGKKAPASTSARTSVTYQGGRRKTKVVELKNSRA